MAIRRNGHSRLEAARRAQDLLGPLIDATSHREATELASRSRRARAGGRRERPCSQGGRYPLGHRRRPGAARSVTRLTRGRSARRAWTSTLWGPMPPERSSGAAGGRGATPGRSARPLGCQCEQPCPTGRHRRLEAAAHRGVRRRPRRDPRPVAASSCSEPDRKAGREPLLKLAKAADPESWPAQSLTMLAAAVFNAGERGVAIDLLRRAQVHHPSDVWINYTLADYLEQLQPPQQDEAIRFYSVARGLRPESAHPLCMRWHVGAVLMRRTCCSRNSCDCGRHTARISPAGLNCFCSGGISPPRRRHLRRRCLRSLRRSARTPTPPRLMVPSAKPCTRQGKWSEAIAEFRAAIRINPKDDSYHAGLGAILCDVKHDYAAAEAEFRTAIRLKPGDPTALCCLGEALRNQGKIEDALAQYGAAIKLLPDEPIIRYDRGLALFVQGKIDEAMADYRAVIRLAPGLAYAALRPRPGASP